MGKVVNQTELAEIMGVSDVTLWEWQKQGMPVQKRGARGEANAYDTSEAIAWRIERELAKVSGTESQKDRLARLQGDKLELDLAVQRGTLIPADEIEPTWHDRVLSAAAFMHSQPSRLAGILEATPGIEAKREVLKTEFADFLTKLGMNGEHMQREVEQLLAGAAADEAASFLRRIAGDDPKPNLEGDAQPGMGEAHPDEKNPSV